MLLNNRLARTRKHTLATSLGAMNKAATEDVRGDQLWPILKAMLDKGKAPSALAEGAEEQLQAWSDRAPWLDLDRDGNLTPPGTRSWTRPGTGRECRHPPDAEQEAAERVATTVVFDSPNTHGGQDGGWNDYMAKDSRTSWGRRRPSPTRAATAGREHVEVLGRALEGADATADPAGRTAGPGPVGVARAASAQMTQLSRCRCCRWPRRTGRAGSAGDELEGRRAGGKWRSAPLASAPEPARERRRRRRVGREGCSTFGLYMRPNVEHLWARPRNCPLYRRNSRGWAKGPMARGAASHNA